MKVWIVKWYATDTSASEEGIVGVFSTEAKANAALEAMLEQTDIAYDYEEWDVDE